MGLNFVVRPLECKSLDGAFRVHLPVEAFEQLKFNLGDICEISDESLVVRGYGIAWRATDRMGNAPKVKPARMSDYLKTVLDLNDGSNVTISKASRQVLSAAKVILNDITPSEYGQTDGHSSEDKRWMYRCAVDLAACEAMAVGTVFDVYVKKGLRRRFRINKIESGDSPQVSGTAPTLYCLDKNTDVVISTALEECQEPSDVFENSLLITTERVGGLLDQLRSLNHQISAMLKHRTGERSRRHRNRGILVHGYEGTGKSLILNELEAVGFRKTLRITPSMLAGSAVTKNMDMIRRTFDVARTSQPSLILLDDLHNSIPKDDKTYAEVLVQEMRNLDGAQVLVVGACRSPSDVSSKLLDEGCFRIKVELPTPDVGARREILDVLLQDEPAVDPELRQSLALRTHGFTGRDLDGLCDIACKNLFVNRDRGVARTEDGAKEELVQEDWDVAFKEIRPSALREISFEKPEVQWSDIGGSQAMKRRFDEIIGWPIHYPEMCKKRGIVPKKGILLYGPPGCSKTLTAQAVASTYDLNFIPVQGAELVSMYVGESERAIREIFRKARAAAPCIVFFDEIDSIASERDSGSTKGLNVLTTLLNEMDGFKSMSDVLVLAATNKPQALDPAIMRPGRFDAHVYLGPPSAEARREIFTLSTRGKPIGNDVNLNELVAKTEGYTGAEVVQICTRANDDSTRRFIDSGGKMEDIMMNDFIRAIENTTVSVEKDMLESYERFGQKS